MKSINTAKISSQNITNRIINPKPLTKGFAPCPNWLLCRPEVSFGAKATYARLIQFADKDGVAWPSQDVLAKELGIKTRQAKTYIQELVRFSLIAACLNGLPASNSYYFLYHPWIDETTQQDRQSSAQQDGQSSAPIRTKKKTLKKTKKRTHTKKEKKVCVCHLLEFLLSLPNTAKSSGIITLKRKKEYIVLKLWQISYLDQKKMTI